MSMQYDFRYASTLKRALNSSALVKVVQGPVESGKTFWLIMSIYQDMCSMPRCKDGIRRSRYLIVRSTQGELERGIMRSWKDIFKEEIYGEVRGSMPAIHKLKFLDVECEVEFFAFEDDSVQVLKKLRSTEYTGAACNEAQYQSLRQVLAIRQRTGRYPRAVDCPDWDRKRRIWIDMNAPPLNDHWALYMRGDIPYPADMTEDEKRQLRCPDDWEFFVQPPAVKPIYNEFGNISDFEIHPDIENLPYQDEEAILSMCQTGDIDDIRRDYMNEVVQIKSGKPRYPHFKREWHVNNGRLKPVEGIPVILGWDPGKYGALTIWQRVNGQWRCAHEVNARSNPSLQSADKFLDKVIEILTTYYPWYRTAGLTCWSDPFGSRDTISPEFTFWNIARQKGLMFNSPMPKDSPSLRHETGTKMVRGGDMGNPKIMICPIGAPTFVDAMDGGCVMQTIRRAGEMVTQDKMLKNKHADVVESAEYAWWGGGEDNSIVDGPAGATVPNRIETLRVETANPRRVRTSGRRKWNR